MNKFSINQSIGDIVATMPSADYIFNKYNIDFYFQGNMSLSEVVKDKKLDENIVLDELNIMYAQSSKTNIIDFRAMSTNELLNYIENTQNVNIVRLLNEISYLSKKVIRGNGPSHSNFFEVHKLLHEFRARVEEYLQSNEERLFKDIRNYEENPTTDLLDRINFEVKDIQKTYRDSNATHDELIEISRGYDVPQDELNSYALIFNKVEELKENVLVQAHLINNIVLKNIMLVTK